ncbi:phosphopantetheine-binding protein [Candidatus Mycoplasma pogonae]
MKNLEDKVISYLKKYTKQKFNLDSDIFKIGIDSLDLVEMVTDLEVELNISISDEELLKIKKVKDVVALAKAKIN